MTDIADTHFKTHTGTRPYTRPVFAVAPMIDWTDRHYRYLARQLSAHALLYTEMIVADAVLRGDRARLLACPVADTPVALQLGGNDPDKLAQAARIGADFGYCEINMNVGCPSDRVQSGTFGACLMREPAVVADCVAAMKAQVALPVTVKCRIGVDDQEPEIALRALLEQVRAAGVDGVWVHARKAWLQGLSPKENREIPPLDYGLVHRIKAENPDLFIGLNGGLHTLGDALRQLHPVDTPHLLAAPLPAAPLPAAPLPADVSRPLDGVMLGRAAYHDSALLTCVDGAFPHPLTGAAPIAVDPADITEAGHRMSQDLWCGVRDAMMAYAAGHIAAGGRLVHVTRHMVGLFQGWPGARRFRQILSSDATRAGAGPEVILAAFAAVLDGAGARADAGAGDAAA
ncbi:tRNA dihydrouridine(20/20a) synthase DusA [Rhizobium sp. Leaf341]|uniref:tRNA dihydrouridine(20/20a) synthase DusA n=1 Tax=Rhizobium sp. Leaf341 TaxID=1736344 RepID=UPI0007162254|nr:tRNA dihydrouridine(20/20a) synthase DusA [Rhizobium sp. Leaf341]KQR68855.1 tRNA-dihydrouridine synthase A [Rhizobium sp. Leaf341]